MIVIRRTACGCTSLHDLPQEKFGQDWVIPIFVSPRINWDAKDSDEIDYESNLRKRTFRYYGRKMEQDGLWFEMYEEVVE